MQDRRSGVTCTRVMHSALGSHATLASQIGARTICWQDNNLWSSMASAIVASAISAEILFCRDVLLGRCLMWLSVSTVTIPHWHNGTRDSRVSLPMWCCCNHRSRTPGWVKDNIHFPRWRTMRETKKQELGNQLDAGVQGITEPLQSRHLVVWDGC